MWGSVLATLRALDAFWPLPGTLRWGGLTVFCGESDHTVDAKHRVFLPKRFQLELPVDAEGARVAVLTRGLDDCLYLFSEAGFLRALERLDTQAFTGQEQRDMQRLFFSFVNKVTLDSSGRVLLSEKMRKLVGIERNVHMVGIVDRVELWALDRYEAFEESAKGTFSQFANVLTGGPMGGSRAAGDSSGGTA